MTTYFADINDFLTLNVPYWEKWGRFATIFTLVMVGKVVARVLVKTIKGDKKATAAAKVAESEKKAE